MAGLLDNEETLEQAPTTEGEALLPTEEVAPRELQRVKTKGDPQTAQIIQGRLDELKEDERDFVFSHLTPELAALFGLVFGQEAFDVFNGLADPNLVLVPMPRDQLEASQGEQEPTDSIASEEQEEVTESVEPEGLLSL